MSAKNFLAAVAVAAIAGFLWMGDREGEDDDGEGDEDSDIVATTASGVVGAQINDDSARILALVQVPGGRITDGGIETEGGKLLYSFDIAVPGKEGVEEIHIDAMTGAFLGREHETAESEAAEKAKESPRKGAP